MSKVKSKILWIIAFTIVIIGFILYIVLNVSGYAFALKTNWNIELPNGYTEVYSYSEASFHGDGIRYHVFEYPAGKKGVIDTLFEQSNLPSLQETNTVYKWLDSVEIKGEIVPDFSACKVIYRFQEDGSELYLFWCSSTGTVYIAESFL